MKKSLKKIAYIFFAISAAVFPCRTLATTVTDGTDQVSSSQISAGSNHKFILTLGDAFSEGETMQIVFPTGFVLTSVTEEDLDIADDGVDLTTEIDCNGSDHASVTVSGQTVTMTICSGDGGTIASGSVVTIEIGTNAASSGFGTHQITNPSSAGSWFVNLTGTSGNSGSVILATSTNGGASVSATVPASGGDGGGGCGGRCGSDVSPDTGTDTDTGVDITTPPTEEVTPVPDVTVPDTDGVPPTDTTPSTPPTETTSPSDNGGGSPTPTTGGSSPSSGGSVPTDPAGEEVPIVHGTEEIHVPEEEGSPVLPETPSDPTATPGAPSIPPIVAPSKPPSRPSIVVVAGNFTETVANVVAAIEEIRALPEIQQAVDVAIPIAAAAAATTAVVLASSFNLLSYLQFLFTSPLLIFARRKRKAFGIVYNSITKVAVDLATVRLYDVTNNRLIRSMVTDTQGKYFFIANPGQYRLTVTKNGFVSPSAYLHEVKDDGVYLDVYTGQTIEVSQKDATIAANIPLDPAENGAQHTQNGILRTRMLRKLQLGLSLSGVFISLGVWFFSPSIFTMMLAVIQVVVFLFFWRLARPRRPRGWGIVFDTSNHRPVGNAVVRLFEPKYNKLVETTLTDTLGRYSFLVGPNEYFVRTDKEGYDQYIVREIDYRQKTEPEAIAIDVPLSPTIPV